ncbi:MAG: hypothetical protein AAB538_04130 [Patescibacteria group bacterium]
MRIIFLITAAALVGIGAVALFLRDGNQEASPSSTPTLTFQEHDVAFELRSVLLERKDAGGRGRLWVCHERRCDSKSWPSGASAEAATNGGVWYQYQDDNLVKQGTGARQAETLIAKTTLVAPRGLFLSPSGKKLAYFLDNIHEEEKELTELWLYDEDEGGTRLLVENIVRPDALTPPRWNSAGTHLWYMADSGQRDEKKVELIVVGVQPPKAEARFRNIQWQLHQEAADFGAMDVSFTGRSVAFAENLPQGRTQLTFLHEGSDTKAVIVRGDIPFLQWLEDGSLIYAIQEENSFVFWRLRSTVHNVVAREDGTLLTARADPSAEYVIFVRQAEDRRTLNSLHIASGATQTIASIHGSGEEITIASLDHRPEEEKQAAPDGNITAPLRDDELAAFIERHMKDIASEPIATPVRLITTGQTNVVFVDYRIANGQERRLLLTVRDAVHPEWSIRARYEPAGGEWRKVQGGGLPDPAPKNVYEWEENLNQWILKSSAK